MTFQEPKQQDPTFFRVSLEFSSVCNRDQPFGYDDADQFAGLNGGTVRNAEVAAIGGRRSKGCAFGNVQLDR